MEGRGQKTRKRMNRRIRRFKRRLFRLFILVNLAFAVCVIFIMFKQTLKTGKAMMWQEEKGKSNAAEDKNGTGDERYIQEKETIQEKKLNEFKSLYSSKRETFKSYTVCLDAGHGGIDVGAEGNDGSYEKNQVLKLSYLVKDYLEAVGVKVVMTRTDDETLSLEDRRNIAENCNANLLLSIHRNVYAGSEEVNGMEAWINNARPKDANEISENILKCVGRRVSGIKNRGVKWGSMDNVNENYGINKVSMASLILEVGFITSDHDNELFEKYLDDIAWGIAQGVLDSI